MLSLVRCIFFAMGTSLAGAALPEVLVNEPLRPLPDAVAGDPVKIELGRRLFYDQRLSRDNRQSCASCHDLQHGGADNKPHSLGAGGKPTVFNSATVYNAAFNFRQGWSGADATLAQRITRSIEDPAMFASSWPDVVTRLARDAELQAQFRAAYDHEIGAAGLSDALQQFIRSLVTPSRFDRYLRGDANAISADEKQGYAKFKSYGCAACHQGMNAGGNLYQKFGAMRELPTLGDGDADLGRYLLTRRPNDRHVFRVPSLRNVALTAPYLHDGSAATLDEAVDIMFRYQLARTVSNEDRALIVRFLQTLNGEQLPPAGVRK